MKRILLLTTGGTIACVQTGSGLVPGLSGEWLLEKIPLIKSLCEVTVRPILNIDSSNITSSDWLIIANSVYEGLNEFDGIVITHGTDTMAYSTAIISYMFRNLNKPVVFTGSQAPVEAEDSDAETNLYQAFKVATSDFKGVCLVFNGKVINGVRAFKMHSLNEDAFVSCNYSYLGKVENEHVYLDYIEETSDKEVGFYPEICNKVFLLKIIPGIEPSIVDYLVQQNYKGVVVEAFGLGGIPSEYNDLLEKFREMTNVYKIPVVVVSQCLYDGTDLNVYNVGVKAEQAGLISGKDMTTEAAVTKLMWALGQTLNYEEIKEIIQTNICGEINTNTERID